MADSETSTTDLAVTVDSVTPPAVPAVVDHVEATHDDTHEFSAIDRTFGKAVLAGYVGGFLVILAFVFVTLEAVSDIPPGAAAVSAIAVAFWMGILGGVVAVGRWASKHEDEIHHA
jgi:hypothetical protein